MSDKIFTAFLNRQFEEGRALARQSDVLKLLPLPGDNPPCRYIARFAGCKGLVRDAHGQIVEFDQFTVGIFLRDDYLRRVEVSEVLTYLGPHPQPWHPNLRPPFICAHVEPGTPLVDLLFVCFELWTWNLFATGDEGLNHTASQWSRRQDKTRFPIDRRPLKRRSVPTRPTPLATKELP